MWRKAISAVSCVAATSLLIRSHKASETQHSHYSSDVNRRNRQTAASRRLTVTLWDSIGHRLAKCLAEFTAQSNDEPHGGSVTHRSAYPSVISLSW